MATTAALRRFAFANKTILARRAIPSEQTTAWAASRLVDISNHLAWLFHPFDVSGRRLRHDDACTGRRSALDDLLPVPGTTSTSTVSEHGHYGFRSCRRSSSSEAAREELLDQLGATMATPPPPARSSRSSLLRAVTPVAVSAARTKRRRRRATPADASSASPYSRPLSLRGRDGANGWSRLAAEGDDKSDVVARLRVKSVHAANSVDVADVLSKVFDGGAVRARVRADGGSQPWNELRPLRHAFGKTGLVVQLPPASASASSIVVGTDGDPEPSPSEIDLPRYVAVFRFGSVVFFNVSTKDAGRILEDIKQCADASGGDPVSSGFERRENFEVAVRPDMEQFAYANGDFATVHELNMNSVAVISTIMAQTVAIDSYSDTVDQLLASFAGINSAVRKTGNFTDMEKAGLFKVVAQNNSLFIDMVGKLGIKDRSDTAWNLSQYERLYEDMREEFEIDGRFGQIEFKLDLIQQNAKFFLEMLHHQKTNSLEWIIVVLIGFECILMCLEMSGMGEVAFAALPWDILNSLNLFPPR